MAAHSLGSVKVLVQVLDLLGLPPLGVPRLDDAPTLADLVDAKSRRCHRQRMAPRSPSPRHRHQYPPRHPSRRHRHRTRHLSAR